MPIADAVSWLLERLGRAYAGSQTRVSDGARERLAPSVLPDQPSACAALYCGAARPTRPYRPVPLCCSVLRCCPDQPARTAPYRCAARPTRPYCLYHPVLPDQPARTAPTHQPALTSRPTRPYNPVLPTARTAVLLRPTRPYNPVLPRPTRRPCCPTPSRPVLPGQLHSRTRAEQCSWQKPSSYRDLSAGQPFTTHRSRKEMR